MPIDWLHSLKRRILLTVLAVMTVSIVATMIALALFLRDRLIDDSTIKTQEIGGAIMASVRSLMITRNPAMIQDVMENIGRSNHSLVKAFILDRSGRIAYSSDPADVGRVIDRSLEPTCRGCHQHAGMSPPERTIMIVSNGVKMQRNVKVLYNEEACYGCHVPTDRVNGKLIIDRSLGQTYSLIASIELIIVGSGLVCLVFLMPILSLLFSRGIDRYIDKIVRQNYELTVLYHMMEQLSMTIDLEELKGIAIEIIGETFAADEVDIIIARDNREFSCVTWTRADNRKARKKVAETDPLFAMIGGWLDGTFAVERVSAERRRVTIPLSTGATRLALIDIRKTAAFDGRALDLVKAVSSHLTVAFNNAFLHYVAITDELTRLYTQRHFRSSIDKQFADFDKFGEKFTLLMMDIDNFKTINDTYGHPAGDIVLREVARQIMASVRDTDLAFRYGGEEFAVLLTVTGRKGGQHVAERIRRSVAALSFEQELAGVHVTISIGVASCPDNATTISSLMQTADRALYLAKQTGKDRVVVSEEMPGT